MFIVIDWQKEKTANHDGVIDLNYEKTIIDCLKNKQEQIRNKKVIIYGFGLVGKLTKAILNTVYDKSEEVIIDKKLSEQYKSIKSPAYLTQNDGSNIVIICCSNEDYLYEIERGLKALDYTEDQYIDVLFSNRGGFKKLEYSILAREDILTFCEKAQVLRTPENCSAFYNNKYSIDECKMIMDELFDKRVMGAYCLCDGPPQGEMRKWILNKYREISDDSFILEVGPGDLPLFDEKKFSNWYACDFNYLDGSIYFSGNIWGKNKYKKIVKGGWENLSEVRDAFSIDLEFDLVCGSHSFEHNHKPITAIKEAAKVLKMGGRMICFVPDGYSTWPGNYDRTHTLYMTEDMIRDLFSCVHNMELEFVSTFRTNMDLVFVAKKIITGDYE